MPKCPYCGRWFKTKRGLKQHITKSHTDCFGVIDPGTIDPFGTARKRKKSRKKKGKSGGVLGLFGL